jgi:HemY protein
MRLFRQVIVLLALAAAGAFLWQLLASDPGYLLITFHGWSVESTLIVAVAALLLLWLLLRSLLWLLRAPWVGWRKRQRRVARERLAGGLLALEEGRWARADKLLGKASNEPALRLPALLAAHRAAHARGDATRASALLAEAGMAGGEAHARLLSVEHLIERQQFASAAELLEHAASNDALSPRGLELRLQALVGAGRADQALDLLPALRRCKVREGDSLACIETATIAAALAQAEGIGTLLTRWKNLGRPQRLQPDLVAAFASRAAALGDADEGAAAIERALKKDWSEALAQQYGGLPHSDRRLAIRQAERWLGDHPGSPGLQLSLGLLCRSEQLWGKAEDYLLRAIGSTTEAAAWEALGGLYADQADDARARQAYANALRATRGEPSDGIRRIARGTVIDTVAEERSSMGVPRLPAA